MKLEKRFWARSSDIKDSKIIRATMAEAIEDAKVLLLNGFDEMYIVQVVRVVKRKDQPVIVEKVT